MADRITVTLHELVAELDIAADDYLRQRHGVSFNLFELLVTLTDIAPVDITGLARCLRVTKAAVSKRLPSLTADGWVTTEPGQGRQVLLQPTPATLEVVRVAGGELEDYFETLLADSRLDPNGPTGIPPHRLNAHLSELTRIVLEKGIPT